MNAQRDRTEGAAAALIAVAVALGLCLAAAASTMRIGAAAILVAAAVYGATAIAVWRGLPAYHPYRSFGAANGVTLIRAGVVAFLAGAGIEGIVGGGLAGIESWRWTLVLAALATLALDGLDGWLARRRGRESAFGARFDLEVDALGVLALTVLAMASGRAGPWVLLAGLLRYGFVAAGRIWPALAAPLPPRFRRKAICAAASAALAIALVPALPETGATVILGMSVLALAWSFGADTVWLLSRPEPRRPPDAPLPRAGNPGT